MKQVEVRDIVKGQQPTPIRYKGISGQLRPTLFNRVMDSQPLRTFLLVVIMVVYFGTILVMMWRLS